VLLLANRARRAVDGGEVLSVESVQAAVACLAASMRRYFDKLAVVSTVCHALVSLCSPGASIAYQRATSAAVSTAECVASIMHVMRAHISDAVIQTACSKLLMFAKPSRDVVRRVVAAAVAHADDVCVELLCIDVLLRCSRHDALLLSADASGDVSATPPLAVVMRSMRRASTLSDSSSVVEFASCVEALRRTAELEPALTVSSGALQCLCQCTHTPMHSEAVHVDALACCSSAVDGRACSTDDLSGVLQWVSATLQAPWSDAAVPLACCASVASILRLCTSSSSGSAIAALCVQRGTECLRSIACAMLRFRHVAEMQMTALQLVSPWSSLSGGLEAVVHSGVLGAIVAMLDIHDIMGDARSCGAATKLLATAMALSGTASAVLSPACVGRCVVTTMTALETHCNVVDVVDSCLTILLALLTATCDDTTETLCRSAPGLVVRALAAHSAVVDIHRRGMSALLELLRLHGRGSSSISDDDEALMADCVRESMRLHASDSAIAESGCSTVELWLTDAGHRVRSSSLVVNRGCVQSAFASMLQQPSRASLRQSVHRIVDAVVGFGSELATRAFSDMIAAASGSMESLPMQMDSVRFMSRTLQVGNTATSDRSGVCDSVGAAPVVVDLCVKAGAIEWLLNTARRHETCELQLEMCGLISLLLTAGSGRSSAVDAADSDDSGSGWKPSDVLKCLSRALLICKDAAGDAVGCLRSFLAAVRSVLPSHSPAVRSKWSEGLVACCYDEVLPSACAAMRNHASSVEVQQLCVDILISLCTFCSACQRSARRVDSSCVEAIVACASAHMTAATVVSPALKCLRFLLGFRDNAVGVLAMSVVECSVASLSSALLDDETVDDDVRHGIRCDAVWLLQRVCATAMSQTEWTPQRSAECIMALCGASRRCGVTAAVDVDVDGDVESTVRVLISLLHRLWQRGVASGDHADACRASIVHCCADGLEDEKDGRLFIRIVDVMDAVTVACDDEVVDVVPDTATRAVMSIGPWLLAMSNKAAVLRSLRFSVSIMRLSLRLLRCVLRSTSCTVEARQRVFSSGIVEVALGQLSLCAADDGDVAAGMPDDCVISWSCECLVVMLSAGYTWGDGVALSGVLSHLLGALLIATSSTSVASCIAVMAGVLERSKTRSSGIAGASNPDSLATVLCDAACRHHNSERVLVGILRCLLHVFPFCDATIRGRVRSLIEDVMATFSSCDVQVLGLRTFASVPLRLDDGSTKVDALVRTVAANEQRADAAVRACGDDAVASSAAELRRVGGVAAAASLLQGGSVSEEAAVALIAAIATLTGRLPHPRGGAGGGFLSVIIGVMGRTHLPAVAMGHCCAALADMAADAALRTQIIASGGVEAVVACMRFRLASLEVQRNGCCALHMLAGDPVGSAAIVASSGIDAVVSAMGCHAAAISVQEHACRALRCLLPDAAGAVANAGGIDAVLLALHRHADSVGVQEHGIAALSRLTWDAASGAAQRAVNAVLSAMQRHAATAGAQQWGCVALESLARNRGTQAVIAAAGGIFVVLAAMQSHVDAAGVQEAGCAALSSMACDNAANIVAIVGASGVDAVLSAMRHHLDATGVQLSGCMALCALVRDNDDNQTAVVDAGGIDVVVLAMQHHDTAVHVQVSGCMFLMIITASSVANQVAVARAGGVRALMSAVQHHGGGDPQVHVSACSALCNLRILDVTTALETLAVGARRIVDVMLDAMRRHADVAAVHEASCAMLCKLAVDDASRAAMLDAGVIDMVATAMERHVDVTDVLVYGCGVLSSLAASDRRMASGILVNVRVCEAVMSAMRRNPHLASLQGQGCEALHKLVSDDSPSRATLLEAGGADVVLSAMERHADVLGVQEHGCGVLGLLAATHRDLMAGFSSRAVGVVVSAMRRYPDAVSVQGLGSHTLSGLFVTCTGKASIVDSGAVDVVRAAMARHADDANVQEHSCCALTEFSADGVLRMTVIAVGGLELIETAMRRHADAPGVQQHGCAAISSLAVAAADSAESVSVNVNVVLSAMRNHISSVSVQASGCGALRSLACASVAHQETIAGAGGIELVVAAMRSHGRSASVQEQACAALRQLASIAPNRARIADAGGLEAVISAMRCHTLAIGVHTWGCAALASLATSDANQLVIAGSGGVAAVLSALRRHLDSAPVQEHGCAALWRLARHATNAAAIASGGGAQIVLAAMQHHAGSAGVQEQGCGALWNLAAKPSIAVAIMKAGGAEAILSAMQRHVDAAGVQERGCAALRTLANTSAAHRTAIVTAGGRDVIAAAKRRHNTPNVDAALHALR
jgi:hypothetical protein